jgi:hypothetical protein
MTINHQDLYNKLRNVTQTPWRNFVKELNKGVTISLDKHDLSEGDLGAGLYFEITLHIGEEEKYHTTDRIYFDTNDPVLLLEEYSKSIMDNADFLFSMFMLDIAMSSLNQLTSALSLLENNQILSQKGQ